VESPLDANVIALGLLVAMSPLPVLAEVLSMTASGRVRPAVALAVGYASALAVIAVAAVILGSQVSSGSTASKTTAIVDLVAGLLLLLGALRTWRRAHNDPDAGLPKWISRVGSMSTLFAFALGAFLPPYVVAVAAGNEIVRAGLSGGMAWSQAAVFVAFACIGVVTPIVIVVASPSGAEARLAIWKAWLERHWQTVVAVILLVAGVYLVIKGGWEFHEAS
jgi:threonine/homoserine/homoserine lactone efflux protein